MSKLMPCDFCKELYEAIDLEQVIDHGPTLVACQDCTAKARRKEELEIMRSRGEL